MSKKFYVGIDIGGTKSTTVLLDEEGKVYGRDRFPTTTGEGNWQPSVERMKRSAAWRPIAEVGCLHQPADHQN